MTSVKEDISELGRRTSFFIDQAKEFPIQLSCALIVLIIILVTYLVRRLDSHKEEITKVKDELEQCKLLHAQRQAFTPRYTRSR